MNGIFGDCSATLFLKETLQVSIYYACQPLQKLHGKHFPKDWQAYVLLPLAFGSWQASITACRHIVDISPGIKPSIACFQQG